MKPSSEKNYPSSRNITESIDKFAKGEGEEAAELARKARDVLKAMLIAKSRWEKKKIEKKRESA